MAAHVYRFFLSPIYVIICLSVAHFDGIHLIWNHYYAEAFSPAIVAEFRSPASFIFYTVNASEDDNGDVIFHLIDCRNRTIVDSVYYDVLLDRDKEGESVWSKSKNAEDSHLNLVEYILSKAQFPPPEQKTQKIALLLEEKELDTPGPSVGDIPTNNPAHKSNKHRYT